MSELGGTAYSLLPLLGGGVFHGLCMKYGWLTALARPIDGNGYLWGKPILGPNKTFRGVVAVGVGSAAVLGVQASILHGVPAVRALELFDYSHVNGWLLGFTAGTAAMLTELPNSFLKRRVGIGAGEAPRGRGAVLFYVFDQVDLLVGWWLVMALVAGLTPTRVALSAAILVVTHQVFSSVGYRLGMRATPR